MADLVTVTRASDGEVLVVDTATAQTMLDNGELTVPPNTGGALTTADLFGISYEQGDQVVKY